jgi:drug/metabolite transporter (DMT)-like permease
MTGALWATLAGIGFGFFQVLNRRGGRHFDPYVATFLLLFISALVLAIASLLTADLSLLQDLSWLAVMNFGLAGFVHFFVGWTLLTLSQNKVGAARTGALVGAAPLFATAIGAIFLDEFLSLPVIIGVFTVVAGVYVVTLSSRALTVGGSFRWLDSLYGLGVAFCFSFSAIFIRAGLESMDSPIIGVTIGMSVSAIAYGILLLFRRDRIQNGIITRDAILSQLAAGFFVGTSTWMRWIALSMAPIGVVLALGRMNVPMVLLLSPILVSRTQERVTLQVWLGAGLIVAGSLLLIFY